MTNIVEDIGLIAGSCTTLAFLPQFFKVWLTRSTKDISLFMYVIFCVGLFLWIIYGICVHSLPVILANIVTLILAVGILLLKIRWERKP